MEFLGVGYQELGLIMLLLLVVVGPERLPAVAYQVGRAVRQMQRYARAVRDEFSEEIDYLEEQYKTVKGEVDVAQQTLREQQQVFNRELQEATAPVSLSLVPSPLELTAPSIATDSADTSAPPPQTAAGFTAGSSHATPAQPLVF